MARQSTRAGDDAPAALPGDNLAPLEAILCTEELMRRPARAPDHATENRALAALVKALADEPRAILQTLADTLLDVLEADSAGMSLLTKDGTRFYWAAIAGAWKPHLGGGTPRDFGPCGDVLDGNAPLLFRHWELRYPYLQEATPLAEEGLLVPFYVGGKAVGTIWTIAHDERRKFDAEDLRLLESLSRFASAAYQAVELQRAEDGRQAMERLNETLRESEERYRTLFDLGPVAVFSCDAAGVLQTYNRHAAELWGRAPDLVQAKERFSGSHKLLRPDGAPLPREQAPTAEVLSGKAESCDTEVLIERPDGSQIAVAVNIRALKGQHGEITGAIGCFYDITGRKRAEQRQQLLIDELNHRVKNTLATVQSIAAHTLRGVLAAESRRTFDARLIALSRTHDLLARTSWEGASLREMLLQQLEPFEAEGGARFVIEGPDIELWPKAALALGLAFHELATNAAKYGALSASEGQVRVTWEIARAAEPRTLRLQWVETGGPPVAKTARKGFGLRVIERGLAFELDGRIALDLAPDGLACTMEIPLPGGSA